MQDISLTLLPDASEAYPVKLVSRKSHLRRTRKMRFAWFALGSAFGFGCFSALTPLMHPVEIATNSTSNIQAPVVLDEADAKSLDAIVNAEHEAALAQAELPIAKEQTPVAETTDEPAKPVELSGAEPETATNTPVTLAAATPAAPQMPVQQQPQYPKNVNLKVENGDTLISLLTDSGASYEDAQGAVDAIRKVHDPRKLDIGQNVALKLDKPGNASQPVIAQLTVPVSLTSQIELTRKNDNFAVKKVDQPLNRKLARAGGEINSSLYETAVSSGLPPALVSEIISAYSYDVDFQRDIHPNDSIDVLFDRLQTKEGISAGHGNLIYAELELGDRTLRIYRYVDKDGHADYYNEKGESVRKALLRTPINGAKITSGFGMRNHPLLGYTKMHRGVDFGAPTGTPIYASGDGTVDFVGKKGGYGNYLRIKHNAQYASAYAHISRYASGITPGHKVRQGQIIAYVGSTGMATGPHLHYEILVNNEQVNPANIKFKTGNILAGKELLAFRRNISQINSQLAELPKPGNKLAMAQR